MPPGLIRRNGRYYLRRVIPLDLQAHFGRREITKALVTSVPAEARERHELEWAALTKAFKIARLGLNITAGPPSEPPLTASPGPQDWDAQKTLEQFEWEQENAEFVSREMMEEDAEWEALEGVEEELLKRLQDPAAHLSVQERAYRIALQHQTAKANLAEQQLKLLRDLSKQRPAEIPAARSVVPADRPATETPLASVVDRWAASERPGDRNVRRTRKIVQRFETVNGKIAVEAVTKQHAVAFREVLQAEGQTPANINVMIPMLGVVFNYAIKRLHLISVNPAAGLRVSDKRKAKEKRRAFADDELKAIFVSPVYTDDARPMAGGGEASYWLPLLSLYTGGRQTELGQLHPDDIFEEVYRDALGEERSAWVIRIVENLQRGQRVKNEGSERRVPVHADLIALGFIKFVGMAKNANQERVFPDIKPNAEGELMGNWSKWFGRYRRKQCGLLTKETPFHSFRHSFKHYARLSGIPNEVHNEFTGHETGDVADSYGGLSYPLAPLVVAMTQYRVAGFTLPMPPPAFRATRS